MNLRLISFLLLIATCINNAYAQIDLTGDWTGASLAGGNTYANKFTLVQQGNAVTGTTFGDGYTCQYTGTLEGNLVTLHNDCPTINYTSDSSASTDGKSMSGTFIDSQGTTGTFSATKKALTLAPNTKIPFAPLVEVSENDVTFTLIKFGKVSLNRIKAMSLRAKAVKLTLQYELSITGSEKRKIISKKNILTAKNLKAGNYSSSYKVTAYQNGAKVYSTKASPKAAFIIS